MDFTWIYHIIVSHIISALVLMHEFREENDLIAGTADLIILIAAGSFLS